MADGISNGNYSQYLAQQAPFGMFANFQGQPGVAGFGVDLGSHGPQYGQPQYGQPQYGQPQFGQFQFGQPPFGQPQFLQPQFGQASFGYSPFGQPHIGQLQLGPQLGFGSHLTAVPLAQQFVLSLGQIAQQIAVQSMTGLQLSSIIGQLAQAVAAQVLYGNPATVQGLASILGQQQRVGSPVGFTGIPLGAQGQVFGYPSQGSFAVPSPLPYGLAPPNVYGGVNPGLWGSNRPVLS